MRSLIVAALAALALISSAFAARAASATDAVAYCKAVGNIDAPDKDYAGPAVPDWMVKALYTPDEIKAQTQSGVDPARAVVWRCMGGKVWACVQGNAPICGKANQDKTPSAAMHAFCAGQPNAEVIPLSVIGHDTPMIYDWSCKGKRPTIGKQIFTVDARGFPAELWTAIAP